MEIEQSSLYPEILAVFNAGANPVHFSWSATIHVNQTGADISAMQVLSVDKRSDYEVGFTDYLIVTLGLLGGVYANQIYPFHDDLDITLTQYPLAEQGGAADSTGTVNARRMQATLRDTGDPQLLGQSVNAAHQDALDLNNFLEVQFQLLDKSLEQLRMLSIGGIWRGCTVGDFLRTTLTRYARAAVVDETLKVIGVDMVPPSNQDVRDHVVIPHGTKLMDVPDYVQQQCGGIYSTGLGSYLRDRYWYLYPALDVARIDQAEDIATIIVVPPKRFAGIERTYRQDPGNLVIIASGDVKFQTDATARQLNQGNGVRYADASRIMDGFVTPLNGRAIASRGNLNSEYITVQRPNGLNNVQMSPTRVTANPYVQASALARRNGSVISVLWENSNDELLKPSMMLNILYLLNDQVQVLRGVLLKTQTSVAMAGTGLVGGRHISSTGLSCFVANPVS
ncbi:hypothetical protein [Paraburkholderia sediminicola]|uniref:hypothetical protein n=1 Tax=Paraburkholderia sediminicola TaxID=458836 RepID=UPI0038B99FB5